jgi:ElaB/YqjD/DUF883 family membrane-anchored ribosome-binding protein
MQTQSTPPNTRAEIRQLADEIELKIHLASMDARDQWAALKKKLSSIEQKIASSSERTGQTITKELGVIGDAIKKFRDDILH